MKQSTSRFWRRSDGAVPNTLAFVYVLGMQGLGLAGVSAHHVAAWGLGVVALAHSMVIAAYLIHEIAHQCLFQNKLVNIWVGEGLSWICGAAYAPMARIQKMHMRHHGDRADLTLYDPRPDFKKLPNWLRQCIYGLEWCYIPAVELVMHAHVMLRPFFNANFSAEIPRVLLMGLSRVLLFAYLYTLNPWSLLGFALAYLLFLTALFIADAYAHTYEFYVISEVNQKVDRNGRNLAYDMAHTWSNLISVRWPWLNLLNLNFGYHTAHHAKPAEPWYRLPTLHAALFPADSPQILPWREIWHSFCINRLARIEADEGGDVGVGAHRADGFLGVHGVSFLSIV